MMHSIYCKNFYSIGDTTEINFVVNENAPQNDGYFREKSGIRLSKIEVVIGPNASGKTNVLKIIPFLKWLITSSFVRNPEEILPVQTFISDELKDKPSEFGSAFEIDEKIYTYNFTLNQKRILTEELEIRSKAKENLSSKIAFARSWNPKKGVYDFKDSNFNLPQGFEGFLRTNASIVGIAMLLNHKESIKIVKFWRSIESNVSEAGWIGDHAIVRPKLELPEALDFFSENEKLKKIADEILSRFDLGLKSIEITKEKNQDESSFTLSGSGIHNINGKDYRLHLNYESSGTKQLLILLRRILKVLTDGGIVAIDEFDLNLHPDIISALIDLFVDPTSNEKNAQILFSAHSHRILNKLDKYQIILVEKRKDGITEAWRLDEMKSSGARSDDNYYLKYIAGAYGAIPKI